MLALSSRSSHKWNFHENGDFITSCSNYRKWSLSNDDRENNRLAPIRMLAHHLFLNHVRSLWIQTGHGFVKDPDIWIPTRGLQWRRPSGASMWRIQSLHSCDSENQDHEALPSVDLVFLTHIIRGRNQFQNSLFVRRKKDLANPPHNSLFFLIASRWL